MIKNQKIEIETELKFDRFRKASWSATFSAKRRPRRAATAPKRVGPTECACLGRIKEGKCKDIFAQNTEVWRYMSVGLRRENLCKGLEDLDLKDLEARSSTLVPDGAAD